ncbi:NAD-dependent malic enzyme [Candidatus Sumerlaeota bacterium]|nr:NAD-dependent malic enzyme [Candidatus Sumerlaeota bacterium]
MTSPSNAITIRVSLPNRPGTFAKVAEAIAKAGGNLGALDIVAVDQKKITRDITVDCRSPMHAKQVLSAVKDVKGIEIINVSDRTFLLHLGGKIKIENKIPVKTRQALSMAYTPGVARVCEAIAQDRRRAYALTIKKNTVAIVTDGTAVLGLGDIGPEAAMPVMEGKAMLFKEFGNVQAFPICLATKDVDEIVETVKRIAPGFGGINLEDISAPRCFLIEERLKQELDIPVFHDDQHGTAVVVLAGLINSLKIVKKKFRDIKVVILGAGAAGVAIVKILKRVGVRDLIVCDRKGIIYRGRKEDMNFMKEWLARHTNHQMLKGDIITAAKGADVFIGVSGPNLFPVKALKKMAKDPIVFAMANPVPEIMPEEAAPYAKIIATGRSDYPNQINNVLCFPGLFRGALDCYATDINEAMKTAAARAIASVISDNELHPEYIIPSVFNTRVAKAVAKAVVRAAVKTGVARRHRIITKVHL